MVTLADYFSLENIPAAHFLPGLFSQILDERFPASPQPKLCPSPVAASRDLPSALGQLCHTGPLPNPTRAELGEKNKTAARAAFTLAVQARREAHGFSAGYCKEGRGRCRPRTPRPALHNAERSAPSYGCPGTPDGTARSSPLHSRGRRSPLFKT